MFVLTQVGSLREIFRQANLGELPTRSLLRQAQDMNLFASCSGHEPFSVLLRT